MRLTLALVAALVLAVAGYALAAGLPGIPKAYQPYKSWTKINKKPIPNTPTTAHPALVKNVYASKKKAGVKYPYGTLIVKEGLTTAGGKRFVSLIAAMRKVRGIDPRHGGWQFTEWSRSSPNKRFTLLAEDATCWSCHALVKKRDWVYTR
jgi:hypothetical protein